MKTNELIGAELDYWVAKAIGSIIDMPFNHFKNAYEASSKFSTEWEAGGPLVEKYGITLIKPVNNLLYISLV